MWRQPGELAQQIRLGGFAVGHFLITTILFVVFVIVVFVIFHTRRIPLQIERRIMNRWMNIVELKLWTNGRVMRLDQSNVHGLVDG
jgi:preprotein translocase subunit SecY